MLGLWDCPFMCTMSHRAQGTTMIGLCTCIGHVHSHWIYFKCLPHGPCEPMLPMSGKSSIRKCSPKAVTGLVWMHFDQPWHRCMHLPMDGHPQSKTSSQISLQHEMQNHESIKQQQIPSFFSGRLYDRCCYYYHYYLLMPSLCSKNAVF